MKNKDENRAEIIHDALNLLEDDLIEEVGKLRGGVVEEKICASAVKPKVWRKWVALAASVAVLIIGFWSWENYLAPQDDILEGETAEKSNVSQETITSENDKEDYNNLVQGSDQHDGISSVKQEECLTEAVVTIPKLEVNLSSQTDGIEEDMLAFFIYEDRIYVENEYYQNPDFVGAYVGTSTGLIDEWTKEDGYVSNAGSVAGDFYEVEGIDPDFMLCMKYENGAVTTFVNNNGITLRKGSDLLEEYLHLKNNYESVAFRTNDERNNSTKDPQVLSQDYKDAFDWFINAFDEGTFLYLADTDLETSGKNSIYTNDDTYHLYFQMNNGLQLQFWIYEDGYVSFHGLNSVCVKIDEDVYKDLIQILQKES